jgi:type II restriction enzyme
LLPPILVDRYHADRESVYHTWFLDPGRLKAFRTIRRGIQTVVQEMENGTFHNNYRGSSLEAVIEAVAEQKQVFAGAAHPFYWKPKLRIPDIYESRPNQLRYATFLKAALKATEPAGLVSEILKLAIPPVKGLGPASGNLLYFLHPTSYPPFNTAIVNGYNLLTTSTLKLGDWQAYLQMREGMLQLVAASQGHLSRDLGDIAGLCFEIGSGRLVAPELPATAIAALQVRWQKETVKRQTEILTDLTEEREHAEQQGMLAELGRAWGYQVWVARNDHSRAWSKGKLGLLSMAELPALPLPAGTRDTVELIDIVWLDAHARDVVAAFEVEKSTSIYSGILRLYDLALSVPACQDHLYLVAPEKREREIIAQLIRPSLATASTPRPSYILFNDLACSCTHMARFGSGLETLKKVSKAV